MKDKKLFNPENFFSQRKLKMWQSCQREYFLHYYAAYGEYDAAVSDEDDFHIHLLKSIKTEDEFISAIVVESLKELFEAHVNIENLPKLLLNNFNKDCNNMLLGEFEFDHKCPLLFDFYYGGNGTIEELFSKIRERLIKFGTNLADNEFFRKLFYRDKLNFYPIEDEAPSISIGNLVVYADLLALIKDGKNFYFLSFKRDDLDFIRFFHLYYGVHKLHLQADWIKTLVLDIHSGEISELADKQTPISEVIAYISNSYSEIPKLDCTADFRAFPKVDDEKQCLNCRFKELCC
ncbi:MAG: hypothetical protein IJW31_03295 [Lentisphaeria bacterium]|nr:hypothetical protein [Lentisphaeria bacterium]